MNFIVKQMWLEALRSDKYHQTQGALRDNHGFCCLGVLCDLYAEQHVGIAGWKAKGSDCYVEVKVFDPNPQGTVCDKFNPLIVSSDILPNVVVTWAELDDNDPHVHEINLTLSDLNDDLYSFEAIADIIEKYL